MIFILKETTHVWKRPSLGMTLPSRQFYFPLQYDGINYPSWSDTVTSGKHTFHIIIVVTGPKSTNGNPTRDIWQRHWGECCLFHWLVLGRTTTSPVWSIYALTQRAITARPDVWPHSSPENSPSDAWWVLINCWNHKLGAQWKKPSSSSRMQGSPRLFSVRGNSQRRRPRWAVDSWSQM